MKILVAAAQIIFASSNLFAQELMIEYDKFEDETTIRTGWVDGSPLDLGYVVLCPGQELCHPENVMVMFGRYGSDWELLRNHAVTFLLNDSLRMPMESTRDGSVTDGGNVVEIVAGTMPYSSFLRLAKANRVEFKVGGFTGAMNERQLGAARLVINRLPIE